MSIRDRVVGFRRVPARMLRPHPKNWRLHPPAQQAALRDLLAEIGFAGAVLARELPDGSLELIDGHLRVETLGNDELPVLIVDLDDAEAEKLLALYDPLAALATPDPTWLGELAASLETQSETLRAVVNDTLQAASAALERSTGPPHSVPLSETYQVVVECRDEDQQRALWERLTAEGMKCRLLML